MNIAEIPRWGIYIAPRASRFRLQTGGEVDIARVRRENREAQHNLKQDLKRLGEDGFPTVEVAFEELVLDITARQIGRVTHIRVESVGGESQAIGNIILRRAREDIKRVKELYLIRDPNLNKDARPVCNAVNSSYGAYERYKFKIASGRRPKLTEQEKESVKICDEVWRLIDPNYWLYRFIGISINLAILEMAPNLDPREIVSAIYFQQNENEAPYGYDQESIGPDIFDVLRPIGAVTMTEVEAISLDKHPGNDTSRTLPIDFAEVVRGACRDEKVMARICKETSKLGKQGLYFDEKSGTYRLRKF